MNMSFSPVFGRRSAEESVWISFLYLGSMSMFTSARPFLSSTLPIDPTSTP